MEENKLKFTGILLIGIVIVLVAIIVLQLINNPYPINLSDNFKKFNSSEDLKSFLTANSGNYGGMYGDMMVNKAVTAAMPSTAGAESASDYSTTNIQVEGVDEADFVKNDGKYIYIASGTKVSIIDAYPAENMRTLKEIEFNDSVSNLFLNDNKLIVFLGNRWYNTGNSVYVYDISDRENPELEQNISIDGYYVDSRMIRNYVYITTQKYTNLDNPEPPIYHLDGVKNSVSADQVYYFDYPDNSYVFTSIVALNVNNQDTSVKTFLTGYTYNIYFSQDNIYLTHTTSISYNTYIKRVIEEVFIKVLPAKQRSQVSDIFNSNSNQWQKMRNIQEIVSNYSNSLKGKQKEDFDTALLKKMEEFSIKMAKETEKTIIHKINVDNSDISYISSGEVPGNVLNQFSMDEYKGKFRIATTTGHVSRTEEASSLNHLYVLDEDLNIIGKVEDLAKGERIYSARFIGKRAYIVTFKKVDPLFVIDLENPEDPEVLGYLKITGYSDYLHPYDETHIIGVGKETAGGDEHFSWYQGLKISLFDVSDVENPKEVAKIEIGDRGTESYALQDHKAFLFDKSRKLLVIPVSLAEIDRSRYGNNSIPDNAYGNHVWQGAYVMNINKNEITLRGKITHFDNQSIGNYWDYWSQSSNIQRSLFMDNVLYTISQSKVKANDLSSLNEIKSVDLPKQVEREYPLYLV